MKYGGNNQCGHYRQGGAPAGSPDGGEGVNATELIDHLTALVKLQADIIKEQSDALEQARAAAELDGMIERAARERHEIIEKI